MPVMIVTEALPREMYEAVEAKVDMAGDRPDGLIMHTATELPAGGVRIVDVWESKAHADAFERDRLMPAMESTVDMSRLPDRPEVLEPFVYIA